MQDGLQNFGDAGYVLPENNQALLHFSNQFAASEAMRRKQQADMQKAEAERLGDLQKQISKDIYKDGALTGGKGDPIIQEWQDKSKNEALKIFKEQGPVAAWEYVNNAAGKIASLSEKAKKVYSNLASGAAALGKDNPLIDEGSLISVAATNAFYTKDKDGNMVLKDPADIDESAPYLSDEYERNWFQYYSDEASNRQLFNLIDKEKNEKVGEPDEYDAKGNRLKVGYQGEVPTGLVGYTRDGSGKTEIEAKNKFYALPGSDELYTDPRTGEPVKVVSDDVFEKYYKGNRAAAAEIERKVRKELQGLSVVAGGEIDPNGDFADFLKRKALYEKLNPIVKDRYSLINNDDKSEDRKKQLREEARAKARLDIAKQSLKLSKDKFAWQKSQKVDDGEEPALDFVDILDIDYGTDVELEDGSKIRLLTGLDPNDEMVIQGDAKTGTFNKTPTIKPKTIKDKNGFTYTGYELKSDGNLYGNEDIRAARNRIQEDAEKEAAAASKKITRQPTPKAKPQGGGIKSTIRSWFQKAGQQKGYLD